MSNYNNTYHTSIKMTPIEGRKKENEQIVYKKLYKVNDNDTSPKFKVESLESILINCWLYVFSVF
jgi:hypothetical protein